MILILENITIIIIIMIYLKKTMETLENMLKMIIYIDKVFIYLVKKLLI